MSNVFFQANNGTDVTTNLNTVNAQPIPVFNIVDSFSNYGSLFTVTSNERVTINFDGLLKLSCCLHIIGDDNRTQIDTQFYINGSGVGPVSSGGFIYDSNRADEASPAIPAYTIPVTQGDYVELQTKRVYDNGDVMFRLSNSSYVMLEVVVESPTLMNSELSSTRTDYNSLSSNVKSLLIDLLVVQADSIENSYVQDVSAVTSGEAAEYLTYLKTNGYGCIDNGDNTIGISW